MSLKPIYQRLETINQDSSRLGKEKLIKQYCMDPLFVKVVYYAVNPYLKFNTTQITYHETLIPDEQQTIENIFKMLDYLSQKRGATNEDINWLSKLSSIDEETIEVVRRIINKDLRCGASIKTFQKFISDLPTFGCMLCDKDLEKFLSSCNNDLSKAVWSIKLDGVRCLGHVSTHTYYSRNGKEFPNFNIFDNSLDKLTEIFHRLYPSYKNNDVHFDGEVIAQTKNAKDFQKVMKQVHRLTNVEHDVFVYVIFDIIIDGLTFGERYTILRDIFEEFNSTNVQLLEHHLFPPHYTSKDIVELAKSFIDQGFEGLVIKNINSKYVRKRSHDWCKIKIMHNMDVYVTGFEYGSGKYENVLGKFICELDSGKKFGCGSGLSDKEREEFLDDLPSMIEIKYQELTDDGVPRFPIFVRARNDKA